MSLLPALAFMAFAGNFLDELLFRGFLQSHLESSSGRVRAALISGLAFAAAHAFLASTVTDLCWPVLVFVLVEGLVCALVYLRWGLISSTIVHGLAILLLSAGLI